MADTKGAEGDSIQAIALDYFKQLGWWVFPAHSVQKQPLITWKDKPRVLTIEELKSWPQWERPGVRLGALTGRRSGFFVVDADSQTAKEYLEFMKHPPCPMAKSGGDHQGVHLYFKLPDFRVKSLARLSNIDGLDIRGEGGIIMLPPSCRPDGRAYEWMISPFGNQLPEAPQWLLESLQRQNEKGDKGGVDIARLYEEGIPYGKRDTEMNRVAGYLRFTGMPLVAAKAVQEQINTDCCQPPLERHVVVDKVWRAFDELESGDVLGTQAFINRDGEDGEAGERPKPRIISDVELMRMEFDPVKWIVPDLIPAGSMVFAGKPKLGKSFFVFDLCLAVATGGTALGTIKVERGDVLYCALEDVERRLKARRKKIMPEHPKGIPTLHYMTLGATIDTGLLEDIEQFCKDHPKRRLVVVDTLAMVKGKQDTRQNIYDADYNTVKGLHKLAGKYNVCLMLVTHTNQSRDIKDPMDLVQGSSGLTGGVDGAAVLLAGRGDAEAFLSIFHRDVESDNTEIAMKREERGTWTYMGDAEKFRMSRQRRKILDAFSNSDASEMYPREVADVIEEKTNTTNRVMLKMADEGVLINRYGKYRLGPSAPVTVTFGPVTYEGDDEEDGI